MKIDKKVLDQMRHIEGFPIGEDEDIIAISNPPHYTAFPNPFIKGFIENYGESYNEEIDNYHREPFVDDVNEGKNDPIYSIHAYHTKVPPRAIEKFIEHYTEPGDIVLDGFCGSGMTGIAAINTQRNCILLDLSPIATFVSFNYCSNIDYHSFYSSAVSILVKVKKEYLWVYETKHSNNEVGIISNVVWSDVFSCPYCGRVIAFWDLAEEDGDVKDIFYCRFCNSELKKKQLNRVFENGKAVQVPVLINYIVGKKRFKKVPDKNDYELLDRLARTTTPYWVPNNDLPKGYNTEQPRVSHGFDKVKDFFTERNLIVLSAIHDYLRKENDNIYVYWFTSVINNLTKRYRFRTGGGGGPSGNLYIPSLSRELNVFSVLEEKLKDLNNLQKKETKGKYIVSTQSITDLSNIAENSIDYIFTDPPFGSNIMYSELSLIWESWLRVFTNNKEEAIINNFQGKEVEEYRKLILEAFKQYYKVLKPNRWITVEFSNSKAVIWNIIQETLAKAGFIVAQVATIDKKQGSFKQVTSPNTVKQDLIINAYKPKREFEERFLKKAGEGTELDFLFQYFEHLPKDANVERTEQMLYSKMLAYYIRHGYEINMNASQFYSMLKEHFCELDGYWFTDEQAKAYEEKKKLNRLKSRDIARGALFIMDERSAIAWLNTFLEEPRTYSDIYIDFTRALTISEDQIPELKHILEENFVSENGLYRRPQVLEKKEIEERREKRLLKEFDKVLAEAKSSKKLKEVRKEAILVGFTQCYREKRFEDILQVGKKLPNRVIESSTEIFDYIDIAEAKLGVL